MKITFSLFVFVLGMLGAMAQINGAATKFALPSGLNESSGAIFFNNRLITHNDSGGETKLYELDTISGIIQREVTISNATNVDWEDLAQDENSIYIGDIGNNNGNRTDLKIYKINKTDYLSSTSVAAETIAFSYANQVDFTSNTNNTEWDAEALVCFDNSNLMLFSKNWVNGTTLAYLVSKTPGNYALNPLATSLNSGGLISGGSFNPYTGKLYLVGYTQALQPFVWVSENYNSNDIFSGTNTQTILSVFGMEQAEAITYVNANRYFMTSESFSQSFGGLTFSDNAKVMAFNTNDATLSSNMGFIEHKNIMYPNPVDTYLNMQHPNIDFIEICDIKSVQVYKGDDEVVDMSAFSKGVYVVKINFKDQTSRLEKLVKK
ncbi:T9SS type A sorting domain-containing protein [Mariniflexile aquimaris]|uniref:T9SS type A sorting domain-containing protein n=1 Tax=Mariniflexile aquimaris TaxID=881009 RepID=A0ABW3BNY3_9FLAO